MTREELDKWNRWSRLESFIQKHCPEVNGEKVLCKDCEHYRGGCKHKERKIKA